MKLPKSLSYDLLLTKIWFDSTGGSPNVVELAFLYKLFNHKIDSEYLVSQLKLYVPNNTLPRRLQQYFNLKF